jgi:hypothetical protein
MIKICPAVKTFEKYTFSVVTNPTSTCLEMIRTVSIALGWEWDGLTPPTAKSTRLIEIPRILSPGNTRTLPDVTFEPKMHVVSLSLLSPSKKKKSSEVTFDVGLQEKSLTDVDALKLAMQKSCNESGSAKRDGKGRTTNTTRQDSM